MDYLAQYLEQYSQSYWQHCLRTYLSRFSAYDVIMSDKKKFRKRKEDESRWQYLNFLLLTFWPLTLLAQIVLSGIYCGILILTSYSTHYTLLMSIVVVAFFMLIVLDNHDKDKPWGGHILTMLPPAQTLMILNISLFIVFIATIF